MEAIPEEGMAHGHGRETLVHSPNETESAQ